MTSLIARVRSAVRPAAREAPWRRRLKVTRSGYALLALTFGVGFAAFNTGNNLLFFGWGLMLSSIVVSGILSESTLRGVHVEPHPPSELRVGVPSALPFVVENQRKLPSFAVEVQALFTGASHPQAPGAGSARAAAAGTLEGARAFVLRVAPGTRAAADLAVAPRRRGRVVIDRARVFTSFPFGFFEKERRVPLEPPMSLVVFPARVDVGRPLADLLTRLGEAPARRPGAGDEIFSLRPFRAGDDPRRIAWRRTAKTGRVVVKETEAARSHDVVLELAMARDTTPEDLDRACELCGSLAEDLLAAGHAVGLRAGNSALVPAVGPRQRGAILGALAVVDVTHTDAPPLTVRRAVIVAVVARGASPSRDASVALHASDISHTGGTPAPPLRVAR